MTPDQLTSRELEVVQLVGQGKTNREISYLLPLTEGTIKLYISRSMRKLGLSNRVLLALWSRGLVAVAMLVLCTSICAAQTVIGLSTSTPVVPGALLTITATLGGTVGQNLQGLGFTLPAGATNPQAGSASTAATKTLRTNGATALLLGWSNASVPSTIAFSDGALLTFTYPVPASAAAGSSFAVSLSTVLAVNAAGNSVPITTAPLTLTVGVAPACVSAINANITTYLATPTLSVLGTIVTELVSAGGNGACQ